MPETVDLDHVAIGTPDARDAIRYLVGELGGLVLFGGQGPGFRPMQIRLGDAREGMTVELLEPWDTDKNDFLARFVARHGEGPHHMTFKVPDLPAMLDRVDDAGFHPVAVDMSDPTWKEAFLHPRESHGTVVQLAEAHEDLPDLTALVAWVGEHGPRTNPQWWPDPPVRGARAARLRRVVLTTPSIDATLDLFAGVLDGKVVESGEGWTELVWPGGGRIRFEQRPGSPGIDRLEGDVLGARVDTTLAGAHLVLHPRGDWPAPTVSDRHAPDRAAT